MSALGARTVFAHPILEAVELPVSPLVAGLSAGAIVLATMYAWRGRSVAAGDPEGPPLESSPGRLGRGEVAGRLVGIAALAVAVWAGRVGPDDELRNLAPALLVGVAWPFLVVGSAAFGPLWRWLDPWDAAARPLEAFATRGRGGAGRAASTYAAALVAAGWTWYLVASPRSLDPRMLALVLGAYSIATVAGAVALGRERYLGSAEPLGLLLAWAGRLRRGRLLLWIPPPGASLVLGAATGGLVFGLIRASSLWAGRDASPNATSLATAGVLGACLIGTSLVMGSERVAGARGCTGAPTAALVPAFVSVVLALAMARGRLFTALQAVPVAATDPFGLGWDLIGTADWAIRPGTLGPAAQAGVQVAILLAGHVLGAVILARRVPGPRDRDAGAPLLGVFASVAVAAVVAV